jgi:hypothetical protein
MSRQRLFTAGRGFTSFGSAHPTGFHMALCDGSLHRVPCTIALTVHQQLCNRHDGAYVSVGQVFP